MKNMQVVSHCIQHDEEGGGSVGRFRARLWTNSGWDTGQQGLGVHHRPKTDPASTSLALSVNIQLNYQRRQLNSAEGSAEENFHRESGRRWRYGQRAAGRRTKRCIGVSLRNATLLLYKVGRVGANCTTRRARLGMVDTL